MNVSHHLSINPVLLSTHILFLSKSEPKDAKQDITSLLVINEVSATITKINMDWAT